MAWMQCSVCDGSGVIDLIGEVCPLCDGFGGFIEDHEIETHEEIDDQAGKEVLSPREPSFVWNIDAALVNRRAERRRGIKSDEFKLDGAPCQFYLGFWPRCAKGPNGPDASKLFVYPTEGEVTMQLQVTVNAISRLMETSRAVKIDGRGRGWPQFSDPFEGVVIIQVYVLQVGDKKILRWPLPRRYELGDLLGVGGFGSVRRAWDNQEKRNVAVKQLLGAFGSVPHAKNLLREVGILSALGHSHIVQIFGVFMDTRSDLETLYIIMELCDTDLMSMCTASRGVSLPEARQLAYNLVVGCHHLHSRRVYHRDLKPENCLVNRDCSVKICDFNLARIVHARASEAVSNETQTATPAPQSLRRELTKAVCTPMYRPPEILLCLSYSESIDVWAVGCILVELFGALNTNGRRPRSTMLFHGRKSWPLSGSRHSPDDLLEQILQVLGSPFDDPLFAHLPSLAQQQLRSCGIYSGGRLREKLPAEAQEAGMVLVEQLICFFPERRLTMEQALTHEFFRRVRRSPDEEGSEAACCLSVTYDESNLVTVEDVQNQMKQEIAKFQDDP